MSHHRLILNWFQKRSELDFFLVFFTLSLLWKTASKKEIRHHQPNWLREALLRGYWWDQWQHKKAEGPPSCAVRCIGREPLASAVVGARLCSAEDTDMVWVCFLLQSRQTTKLYSKYPTKQQKRMFSQADWTQGVAPWGLFAGGSRILCLVKSVIIVSDYKSHKDNKLNR